MQEEIIKSIIVVYYPKLYLDELKNILNKKKINYELVHHNNPDIDFIFISSGKHYVPSGGNFSRIAGNIVKNNGGTVYDI